VVSGGVGVSASGTAPGPRSTWDTKRFEIIANDLVTVVVVEVRLAGSAVNSVADTVVALLRGRRWRLACCGYPHGRAERHSSRYGENGESFPHNAFLPSGDHPLQPLDPQSTRRDGPGPWAIVLHCRLGTADHVRRVGPPITGWVCVMR
jgi:hypothetical protein